MPTLTCCEQAFNCILRYIQKFVRTTKVSHMNLNMKTMKLLVTVLSITAQQNAFSNHTHTHSHSHTHTFNGPLSRTTQVSRYQKGKTNLDFTEARDSEWQWHQLGSMHVCTLLQTDNHASTPPLCFFTGRPFLPPNQQCQSTEG